MTSAHFILHRTIVWCQDPILLDTRDVYIRMHKNCRLRVYFLASIPCLCRRSVSPCCYCTSSLPLVDKPFVKLSFLSSDLNSPFTCISWMYVCLKRIMALWYNVYNVYAYTGKVRLVLKYSPKILEEMEFRFENTKSFRRGGRSARHWTVHDKHLGSFENA